MASTGIRFRELLPGTAMQDVPAIVAQVMQEHREDDGCEFFPGAYERVIQGMPDAEAPMDLADYLGDACEREESRCPLHGTDRR